MPLVGLKKIALTATTVVPRRLFVCFSFLRNLQSKSRSEVWSEDLLSLHAPGHLHSRRQLKIPCVILADRSKPRKKSKGFPFISMAQTKQRAGLLLAVVCGAFVQGTRPPLAIKIISLTLPWRAAPRQPTDELRSVSARKHQQRRGWGCRRRVAPRQGHPRPREESPSLSIHG